MNYINPITLTVFRRFLYPLLLPAMVIGGLNSRMRTGLAATWMHTRQFRCATKHRLSWNEKVGPQNMRQHLNTVDGARQTVRKINTQQEEKTIMAFKNEIISEQDREWVAKLVTYENIKAVSRRLGGVHGVHDSGALTRKWWTANHDQNAYFISLGGGGHPDDIGRMPYAVLAFDRQIILFNLVRKGTGNGIVGRHVVYEIHNLTVPLALESREEEIKQILREALEEYTYCSPFADGGTVAHPNLRARSFVKSVNVEFK